MDYIVHGILQARILEWVAFPFYRGSSQPRDQIQVSLAEVDSLSTELSGKPHHVKHEASSNKLINTLDSLNKKEKRRKMFYLKV